MVRRPNRVALVLAALALLLHPGGNLYANAGYPLLFPHSVLGLLVVTPIIAFLEKFFVGRAGLERRVFLHSLIGNSISAVIGFLAVPHVLNIRSMWMSDFGNALLASTSAGLLLSIVCEGLYYCFVLRKSIRWHWVIIANILTLLPIAIIAGRVG